MSNGHDEAQSADERRHFSRFPFEGRVRIFSGDRAWETSLIDLSLKGVLLTRPDGWEGREGQRFRVDARLEGGIVISMSVSAVTIEAERLGFQCERIDMDSFSHLKRIVQLNLGAQELLNRELAALG